MKCQKCGNKEMMDCEDCRYYCIQCGHEEKIETVGFGSLGSM